MGGCLSSCCARARRALRLATGYRRTERDDDDNGRHRRPGIDIELETAPVMSDPSPPPSPPRGKYTDDPAGRAAPIHIDASMSSPTIHISGDGGDKEEGGGGVADGDAGGVGRSVSGHGLALAAGPVGSHGAYWEWHMGGGDGDGGGQGESDHENVMVGVSTKRTPAFYEILAKSDGAASSLQLATKLMRTVRAGPGDAVGVAIDLGAPKPYVQLLLNGELQEEFHLGRFRGSVYPSIWLPKPDGTASATFMHDGADFRHRSPGLNFLPLTGAEGGGIV